MNNRYIFKLDFSKDDYHSMDARIRDAIHNWRILMKTDRKGNVVSIPGTWNAIVYPYKYFEIYKKPYDPNPGEDENEIQCYLSCGWRGCDDEVVIVLTLLGKAVNDKSQPVNAEIYKFGGNDMEVYYKNKLITNFHEKFWKFFRRKTDKAYTTIA